MTLVLFDGDGSDGSQQPGAYLHRGVVLPFAEDLRLEVQAIDHSVHSGQIPGLYLFTRHAFGWKPRYPAVAAADRARSAKLLGMTGHARPPLTGAYRINLTFRSVALPPSGSRAP